jgi:uncharacterized membrane protein
MYRDDDPEHWTLLIFYHNREHPWLFVPKRTGIPFTLNFARPAAWLITAAIFALIVFAAVVNNR